MRLARVFLVPALMCWPLAEAQAEWLLPAQPTTPVAFTFPAVQYYDVDFRVRRAHLTRRAHVHRHVFTRKPVYMRRHVGGARFYGAAEYTYLYPPTGWRPLPYSFGQWPAGTYVLR